MGRVIVLTKIYHYESDDINPTEFGYQYEKVVQSPALTRKVKVEKTWKPLGTIPQEFFAVTHLKTKYDVIPTEEKRLEDISRVVEIRTRKSSGKWYVPYGESLQGLPSSNLEVRCPKGDTEILIFSV